MFPLYAISEPSRRQGSGLVETEVGVLPFVTRSHCAPSLNAVMIFGGFPLHRRAWNSVTIKQGLAVTGGFWDPGWPWTCWSISSVFPAGGSAG